MTVTLDDKGRATLGPNFHPGDSVKREVHGGTVIFRKVEVASPKTSKVKFEKRGGFSVGVLDKPIDEGKLKEALSEFP